jgi:simple sugar transport system permease protein
VGYVQKIRGLLVPVISILIALAIGAILIALQGASPVVAYKSLFTNGFLTATGIKGTLALAAPLVFTGVAVAFALRAGLFNIGAQGQVYAGGLMSAWFGFTFHLPSIIEIPLALLVGAFFGGLGAAVAGLLKAYRGVHEVISTIMLNTVIASIATYLARGPWVNKHLQLIQTKEINKSAFLPNIGGVTIGFFIAVALAFLINWVLRRTTTGFKLETLGQNRHAAWYSGISVKGSTILAMVISGAIAGFGGGIVTLGVAHFFDPSFSPNLGFDGITIALLGRAAPLAAIPGAILIGGIRYASSAMQFDSGVNQDIVTLITALILFFATVPFIANIFKGRRKSKAVENAGGK